MMKDTVTIVLSNYPLEYYGNCNPDSAPKTATYYAPIRSIDLNLDSIPTIPVNAGSYTLDGAGYYYTPHRNYGLQALVDIMPVIILVLIIVFHQISKIKAEENEYS